MVPLFEVPYRASIAFDRLNNELYLLRVDSPAIQVAELDGLEASLGALDVPGGIGNANGVSGATWHNGELYVALEQPSRVVRIPDGPFDPQIYSSAPVSGGDIAFGPDGLLKLVSRSANRAFNVIPGADNELLSPVSDMVSGLMLHEEGEMLLLEEGKSFLRLVSPDGENLGVRIRLYLNGERWFPRDGDLASGCMPEPAESGTASQVVFSSTPELIEPSLGSQPNPTAGASYVNFELPKEVEAQLAVFDLTGRRLDVLFQGYTKAGERQTIEYDTSHLRNGVYLYHLSYTGGNLVSKFVVAH